MIRKSSSSSLNLDEVVRRTLIGVIAPEMSNFAVFGHYIDSKTNRQKNGQIFFNRNIYIRYFQDSIIYILHRPNQIIYFHLCGIFDPGLE